MFLWLDSKNMTGHGRITGHGEVREKSELKYK